MKIINVTEGSANMTSLQGYLEIDYTTLVECFGEPTYTSDNTDDKVSTEWTLQFEIEDEYDIDEVKTVYATIYDWKDYDGGMTSRSGAKYNWHIGGDKNDAVDAVTQAIKN